MTTLDATTLSSPSASASSKVGSLRARCVLFQLLFVVIIISLASTSHAMAVGVKQVAVIGATGRLGRLAVQQLVSQGIPCKLLLRRPLPANVAPPASLEDCTDSDQVAAYLSHLKGVSVVQGNVGNVESLRALVQDCEACLALYGATRKSKLSDLWNPNVADEDPSHAKQVNYQGVLNLLQACSSDESTCKRIVRITGKGENPTSFISILINMLGSMAKAWNYQGEQALRGQDKVDYTIIRPGIMVDEPSVVTTGAADDDEKTIGLTLADNGGDLPVSKIPYADVASLCVECLDHDNAARTTLCAMTADTTADATASSSWGPLLAKVQADRRTFPQDMLEQHYAAVRKTLFGVGAFAVAALALLIKWIF